MNYVQYAPTDITKISTVYTAIKFSSTRLMMAKIGYNVISVEGGCMNNVRMFRLRKIIKVQILATNASNAKK